MLTKRIIACLDVANGRVVKGVKFGNHRDVGDVVEMASKYCDMGVDELVLYDIKASCEGKDVDCRMIERVARVVNIPFCVAGKIDSVQKARAVLNSGADKVSVNSPALSNPDLINELVRSFGSSTLVVGIDTKDGFVYKNTGDELKTELVKTPVLQWALEVCRRGAGEIVINSMSMDGVKGGYDIALLKEICDAVDVPVVASGGAGEVAHFVEVFAGTGVSAALAASVFHDGKMTPLEVKSGLKEEGFCVRI